MKPLMPPIDTLDKLFHDGNPATGVEGTIVTAAHLNNEQDSIRDLQSELIAVLTAATLVPDSTAGQLLKALKALFLLKTDANTSFDGKQPKDATLTALSGKDVAGLLTYLGFGNGTGWTKLPDGTVIQRGYMSGYSDYTVTLPVPYTSLDFQVVATCEGTVAQAGTARAFVETVNTGPGTFTLSCVNAAGVTTARAVKWIAVGKI